jgi:hypothetical protein
MLILARLCLNGRVGLLLSNFNFCVIVFVGSFFEFEKKQATKNNLQKS